MPLINIDTLSIALVSLAILAASAAMMVWHVRSWRTFRREETDAEEIDYRRRQYRRRMQTSAMIGLLAIALSAGHVLIQWLDSDWFAIAFWGVAMLVTFWVALLALVDVWSTQQHFGRKRRRNLVEEINRQVEALEQAGKTNGRHL